jgi:RNA polymerase sigma factor (sigma-70 family)
VTALRLAVRVLPVTQIPNTESSTMQTNLRGDEAALFAEHHDRLIRIVRWAVRTSDATVEDACSFAWSQLIDCQPERAAILAWLRTVAVREAIRLDRLARRCRPVEELPADDEPAAHTVEQTVDAHEALAKLAALPPRQKNVLARQVAGLTYDEIAEETGDSCRTTERQLRRARARVRAA